MRMSSILFLLLIAGIRGCFFSFDREKVIKDSNVRCRRAPRNAKNAWMDNSRAFYCAVYGLMSMGYIRKRRDTTGADGKVEFERMDIIASDNQIAQFLNYDASFVEIDILETPQNSFSILVKDVTPMSEVSARARRDAPSDMEFFDLEFSDNCFPGIKCGLEGSVESTESDVKVRVTRSPPKRPTTKRPKQRPEGGPRPGTQPTTTTTTTTQRPNTHTTKTTTQSPTTTTKSAAHSTNSTATGTNTTHPTASTGKTNTTKGTGNSTAPRSKDTLADDGNTEPMDDEDEVPSATTGTPRSPGTAPTTKPFQDKENSSLINTPTTKAPRKKEDGSQIKPPKAPADPNNKFGLDGKLPSTNVNVSIWNGFFKTAWGFIATAAAAVCTIIFSVLCCVFRQILCFCCTTRVPPTPPHHFEMR